MKKIKKKGILAGVILLLLASLLGIAFYLQTPIVIAKILWMNTRKLTQLRVEGDTLVMNGPINRQTYGQVTKLIAKNPQVTTLVEEVMPGSLDDDTMIKLAYFVREQGLNTHLRSFSQINSGAVDLFLAGTERTMERGAHIGVHSWSDGNKEAVDFPKDAPEHEKNRKYVETMLGNDAFYWFTIQAAPAGGIYEMSEEEILRYGLLTQPIIDATPPAGKMTGVMASKLYKMGNPESDTVLLIAQGGPITTQLGEELRPALKKLDRNKLMAATVAQAQTIDPNHFTKQPITFDEAKEADAETVAILADMVQWYQAHDKKVYVAGFSFGAFIVQDLLATQGNVADGYLIVVGRLDMPDEVWQVFADGRMVGFEDGVTIIPVDAEGAGMGGQGAYTDANMAKLAAGLAYKRYTQLLAETPMQNVVYVYGEKDDQVGRLSTDELAFLKEKGVTVIVSPGKHIETFEKYLSQGLKAMMGERYFR
jgi:hypothetical protein